MEGLFIGVLTFLLIGLFHPFVIKGEYYFGRKLIYICVVMGIFLAVISILMTDIVLSIIFGIISCCFFWSIIEVFEQEVRVLKGLYKMNPKNEKHYELLRKKYIEKGRKL